MAARAASTALTVTEMYNQMMAKREALAMNPDSKIYPEFKKAIDMGITDVSAILEPEQLQPFRPSVYR